MKMNWNKESIQALLDSKPQAVVRALIAVYELQTEDEKASHSTRLNNGVGFGAYDAEYLTRQAQYAQKGGHFSAKNFAIIRNKMKRYWRQLAEIANQKEAKKVAVETRPMPAVPDQEYISWNSSFGLDDKREDVANDHW
jgi:hypothetical protein